MDRPYRVSFVAKPIVVHASSPQRAREIAIEYLRQPETKRIVIEEGKETDAGS